MSEDLTKLKSCLHDARRCLGIIIGGLQELEQEAKRGYRANMLMQENETLRSIVEAATHQEGREFERQLCVRLTELQEEVEDLTDIIEGNVRESLVRSMKYEDGAMEIALSHPMFGLFNAAIADMFIELKAVNYIEQTIFSPKVGLIVITCQKVNGKSPHQLRQEAGAERDVLQEKVKELEAEVERHQNNSIDQIGAMLKDAIPAELEAVRAELERARAALTLCIPFLQMDVFNDETMFCHFCGQDIDSGDEHGENCKQMIAYRAVQSALNPTTKDEDANKPSFVLAIENQLALQDIKALRAEIVQIQAELAQAREMLREVYGAAIFQSCTYGGTHPDADVAWHCCDWGPWAERVAQLLGIVLKGETDEH